jgi:hypothetical protein
MSTDSLAADLVEMLEITRTAERDVFGALAPDVRERPLRPGDWSPKDHLAHLAAWKARQADRYAAVQHGEEPGAGSENETDAINAELQRETAGLSWQETEDFAQQSHERLVAAIEATDPARIRAVAGLIGSTFGNGADHATQHFGWLRDARIGVDADASGRFVAVLEQLVARAALPDTDRGIALYNTACYLALDGQLDRARTLLRQAFALDPDLVRLAPDDPDLAALRDELPAMTPQ